LNTLKLLCLAITRLARQVWLFPQSVALAFKQRRRQFVLNENEVERLDRLRNPAKYRGR